MLFIIRPSDTLQLQFFVGFQWISLGNIFPVKFQNFLAISSSCDY